MSSRLVLMRHGQSVWNQANRFTGWNDVALTDNGEHEARMAATRLKEDGFAFNVIFTSALARTRRTAEIVAGILGGATVISTPQLNERDYGDLSGLNKDEARRRYGEERVRRWRRSYTEAPPAGESLQAVQARLLCYYVREILPAALEGKGVLMVGHGNTVRALAMAFEDLSPSDVENLEISTGRLLIFQYNAYSRLTRVADACQS